MNKDADKRRPHADRRRKSESKIKFTLIAAVTLDGRITEGKRGGTRWTSSEDKKWFRRELARYDALIMGRKTFDAIPRPLVSRNRIVFTTKTTSL